MTMDGESDLGRLLQRLHLQLVEPVDFDRDDPESTAAKVRLLTAAAIYFNVMTVTDFGGRIGPERQDGLVEQVVAAAFQTYSGDDPHPSPFDKAAMLLRGIVQGHPFTDANKRTGFLVATYYLQRTGFVLRPNVPVAEVVTFCRRLSAGELRNLDAIAETMRAWSEPRRELPEPE